MTVRHALLPVGAVLVLGLGVYLFVEVRAQPAPPSASAPAASSQKPARPAPPPAEARVQQPTAPPNAAVAAVPRPGVPPRTVDATPAPREVVGSSDAGALIGPKLDAVMDEANKAYDRGDFEDARVIAGRVLAQNPSNVRMLRVMVSAACIDGDSAVAQTAFARLPTHDQEQMRVRCARYGVAFSDK